jgi:hypothetical protein
MLMLTITLACMLALSVVDRGQTKPKTITLACMLALSVVDRGQTKPKTITLACMLAFANVIVFGLV